MKEGNSASEEAQDSAHPTSIEDWLLKQGLYARVQLDDRSGGEWVKRLRTFKGTLDVYCIGCKQKATFQAFPLNGVAEQYRLQAAASIPPIGHRAPKIIESSRLFEVTMWCTRERSHRMIFYFAWTLDEGGEKGVLEKIGQAPSFADISFPDTRRFAALLGDEKFREYRRGLGLFAHGANIGAFVYLRRVFEHLVEKAHEVERSSPSWNEDAYKAARMDGHIKMLAHLLPDTLVKNAQMYGILSKGVHELSEDECGIYFETVHQGIELILTEELAKQERERKAAAVASAVAEAVRQLK